MTMPKLYAHAGHHSAPRILREACNLHGVMEVSGDGNNPQILAWADEIGGWIGEFYNSDQIPWCGLFVAVCAKRAGFPFNQKALSAKEWVHWGHQVFCPMLGDVLIFQRPGGGHVGFYVAEDETHFHVLGGNQSDAVNISRISKKRLWGARRCPWDVVPKSVKRIHTKPHGAVSKNEG